MSLKTLIVGLVLRILILALFAASFGILFFYPSESREQAPVKYDLLNAGFFIATIVMVYETFAFFRFLPHGKKNKK
jgi:hypothetical protein